MSHRLEIHQHNLDLIIKPSEEGISLEASNPLILSLIKEFLVWHDSYDIHQLKIKKKGSGNPITYEYFFEDAGGRTWIQDLLFYNESKDPLMTFNVTGEWAEFEFAPHRTIRRLCIHIINETSCNEIKLTIQ